MSRCRFSLGNDRFIEVIEWKGELRVDLREWKDDKPTKKGISLTLMRWKNWVDYLEYADQARTEKQNYKSHLGGNVYCTITEGSACMDIKVSNGAKIRNRYNQVPHLTQDTNGKVT